MDLHSGNVLNSANPVNRASATRSRYSVIHRYDRRCSGTASTTYIDVAGDKIG